jgi:hypothetical protein
MNEMSSISTLEFVWEKKSLWPDYCTETYFCSRVAKTNKLELLKWIREEKKCEWDGRTINVAAEHGNLEMVKYCVANECPIHWHACAYAASGGHLEVLKYLREEAKAPWDSVTPSWAAQNGHLHILEYLVERKFVQFSEGACAYAAENGHLDCLKYLRETAKAPWDYWSVRQRTRTTKPNVYNTSSTTTAHYHLVGDTNMERYTRIRIIIIIIIIIRL